MLKKYLMIAGVAMLASCAKESVETLETVAVTSNQSNLRKAASEPGRFIVELQNAGQIESVRAKLLKAGLTETGFLPELGLVFVSANNESALASTGLSYAPDLEVMEEPVSYIDNPPSSGDNDPYHGAKWLWGIDAVQAPQAWNMGYRGAGVVVAVLDGGFYTTHTDLAANLLTQSGKNFVECPAAPDCNPNDVGYKYYAQRGTFSHATHVAGTIAAVDNNIGVIGVAPDAKILPVKVLSDRYGSGLVSWIANGIVYAVDNGADIINMSLGGFRVKGIGQGSNNVQAGLRIYDKVLQYAKNKGVTVVVAVGNDAINLDGGGPITFYPAGSPHVISVSATAPNGYTPGNTTVNLDEPASYTNYGVSAVDISAPGGDFDLDNAYDGILSLERPGFLAFAAGTSMAAPHVAGVAALLLSKDGTLSPAAVKSKLLQTADHFGKPGRDPFFGFGRVNAEKAVQ